MTAIGAALVPGARNGYPPGTGYVYRGRKPGGYPDLETLNAAIMADRETTFGRPPGARKGDACGTPRGYRRHLRNRKRACQACLAAQNALNITRRKDTS